MWTFFIISTICINISIVLLIRRYADKGVEWIVRIATAYAWLTSMCIVALVPLDVWTTLAGVDTGRTFVGVLWSVAYWSTQLATWLVLPFYQVYSEAGDFTVKERAWTSIKENALLYGIVGGLAIIGIAALFIMRVVDVDGLLGLGVGLSNAFGLIAGLLLMGYGLVEIPRQVWKGSNPETSLKWACHRSGLFAEAVMKARVELRDVITIIYANQRQMRRHDPLQKYMEIVFEYAERESPIKPSEMANRSVDIDHLNASDLEYNYDKAGLAALRRRLFWAISDFRGAHARYADVVVEALEWEAVVKARSTQVFIMTGPVNGQKARVWDAPLWYYNTRVRPFANRFFAVILVFVSLCIVWGEVTIPIYNPDMSPFSLLIKSVDKSDEFFVQLFTLLPLVYICASMYFTLFRINAFNYNKLIVRATTGAALMQNGSLMCRFAAPTCWNFYHIIHMTKDFCPPKSKTCLTQTVFDDKMSSLSVLPSFLNLNVYLPVILGVHCLLTALNMWDRLLNCCKGSRFRFTSDDIDDEYTEKGRLLIRKEADAMAMGYKVGDILSTAYIDLQFPPVRGMERAGTGQQAPSKGIFGSLFGRKPLEPVAQPPTQVVVRSDPSATAGPSSASVIDPPTAPKSYTTAAAQAARQWLAGGRKTDTTAPAGGSGAGPSTSTGAWNASTFTGHPPPPPGLVLTTENPKISLLGARMDNSSSPYGSTTSSTGPAAPPASGLDGIFANLR